ncbi:hypothetical protein DENSPDRAFT_685666 [Dentipellis sp. KUC8613]|nr:hypothetical protein DENSPDRAFT_685666 [Dentipellis sp. KUC8613]
MPLRGTQHSPAFQDEAPFFDSLADLDAWSDKAHHTSRGVLPYHPPDDDGGSKGKLLACHDFKGGYYESPSAVTYTFNFWPLCSTFIYFSHHRVTIPPSGWTTTAHRHGTKMLGTLIFEHQESEGDCLRLLFGKLPTSKTGPAESSNDDTVPTSPHYARVLADLARERGFDGYLLNFEYHLRAGGGVGQTRALAAWIALLTAELKTKVGPHAEVIWYDSVVFTGQLRWQDRLNNYNLPFFIPSTGFFTNYTWPPTYPSLTAQYLHSLAPPIRGPKTPRSVYTGIDVWGRGSHGGGGLGCFRALEHITPAGTSTALFGQGWTWESQQDAPGWDWDAWWALERLLWLGPESDETAVVVPPAPLRKGEQECPHGPFKPLRAFFEPRTSPDPARLPFWTAFCPGVGWSWFVRGERVLQTDKGWTDVQKQSSLGDLLWPRPALRWEHGERDEALPVATPTLHFAHGWIGGNSVRVAFTLQGSDAEDAFFRCVWLPVQTLAVTPGVSYDAHVIFKADSGPTADLDIGLVPKLNSTNDTPLDVSAISTAEDLPHGWTKQSVQFTVDSNASLEDRRVSIGLVVGVAAEDPSQPLEFAVVLGQISVHACAPSPPVTIAAPRILWADFQRTPPPEAGAKTTSLGTLSWEIAATFPSVSVSTNIPSVEDPNPIWHLDTSDRWMPAFSYFNIYVHAHSPSGYVGGPEDATFIGTTGLDGKANEIHIGKEVLPKEVLDSEAREVRFYVQGVTDRGEVLAWNRCVFVDAMLR